MITVSSNFAANLLIEKLGVDNIRRTVTALGADGMQVLRGVEDQKAFDKGLNNTTTARGLLVLFEKLAAGRAVDPKSDAAMIEILSARSSTRASRPVCPPARPWPTRPATSPGSITMPAPFLPPART